MHLEKGVEVLFHIIYDQDYGRCLSDFLAKAQCFESYTITNLDATKLLFKNGQTCPA